jgi:hypothetical protein
MNKAKIKRKIKEKILSGDFNIRKHAYEELENDNLTIEDLFKSFYRLYFLQDNGNTLNFHLLLFHQSNLTNKHL